MAVRSRAPNLCDVVRRAGDCRLTTCACALCRVCSMSDSKSSGGASSKQLEALRSVLTGITLPVVRIIHEYGRSPAFDLFRSVALSINLHVDENAITGQSTAPPSGQVWSAFTDAAATRTRHLRAQWRALSYCIRSDRTTTRIAAFTSAAQLSAMIEAGHDGGLCELELMVADDALVASKAKATHSALAAAHAATPHALRTRADCLCDGTAGPPHRCHHAHQRLCLCVCRR
jgi:hypothetical protein